MTNRSIWLYAAAGLWALRLLVALDIASDGAAESADYDRFWSIAVSAGRPDVSYSLEYTPFTVELLKGLKVITGNRVAFGVALVGIAVAADLIATAALAWAFGWSAAALYLLVSVPLLHLSYNRFDLVPAAAAAVAVAGLRRTRPILSSTALLTGIALKLWPLPLSALLLRDRDRTARRKATITLVIGGAGLVATWLALAGVRGTLQITTFRQATGWHIEAVVGNLIALSSHRTLRHEAGAFRIGSISSETTIALLIVGSEIGLGLAWLGAETRRFGSTWLCSVGALLLFSPLLSPQFMVWIAPGAAMAWVEGDRVPAMFAAVSQVLTSLAWARYDDILRGSSWEFIVTARNVALLAMTVTAAAVVLRASFADARRFHQYEPRSW